MTTPHKNETLEERLQREAREEYGCKQPDCNLVGDYHGTLTDLEDLEEIISHTIAETLKAVVSAIEEKRTHYIPADLIWEGDEEEEVGEWKYVPAKDAAKAMYCLTCKRFLHEEGCICGMITVDTAITAVEGVGKKESV